MSSYKKNSSVGIKELKDRASEIVGFVERTGHAISITRNRQAVARITPVPADARGRLIAAGLLRPGVVPLPLGELKIGALTTDASPAIAAILGEREET